jgi:hypothetical protein
MPTEVPNYLGSLCRPRSPIPGRLSPPTSKPGQIRRVRMHVSVAWNMNASMIFAWVHAFWTRYKPAMWGMHDDMRYAWQYEPDESLLIWHNVALQAVCKARKWLWCNSKWSKPVVLVAWWSNQDRWSWSFANLEIHCMSLAPLTTHCTTLHYLLCFQSKLLFWKHTTWKWSSMTYLVRGQQRSRSESAPILSLASAGSTRHHTCTATSAHAFSKLRTVRAQSENGVKSELVSPGALHVLNRANESRSTRICHKFPNTKLVNAVITRT